MSKHPKGLTLSEEERALVHPGASSSDGSSPHNAWSLAFDVLLPNGKTCPVAYNRYSVSSHKFDFGEPVRQCLWSNVRLDGSSAAVEAKAQELLAEALQKAQAEEQKGMRQKTSPSSRRVGKPDTGPDMDARSAERFAGKYACCFRFASGRLIRIGPVYDTPDRAAAEIRSGKHSHVRLTDGQEIVVGICNRPAQRWQEPEFLPDPVRLQAQLPPEEPHAEPLTAEREEKQKTDRRSPGNKKQRAQAQGKNGSS
jgi:hypothetical protein